jgi:hypothetical protein
MKEIEQVLQAQTKASTSPPSGIVNEKQPGK